MKKTKTTYGPSAILTTANLISSLRLLASPFLVILVIEWKKSWVLVGLWILVSATDFLDGYFARRQGSTTSGAFLDPLADKVAVLSIMIALAWTNELLKVLVGLIVLREVGISLYRSIVLRKGTSVPAKALGKLKTVFQDLTVLVVLVPVFRYQDLLVNTFLYIAVILTILSAIQYMLDARLKRRA